MNTNAKKTPKMNKIVHISDSDNHKSDFTEKPKVYAFFQYFHLKFSEINGIIALGPYLSAQIFK